MPIKPENKSRYPKNWKEISRDIRHNRADNRCEFCGAINHSYINSKTRELCLPDEYNAIRVVLTVAHLDHQPENSDPENLKALCQRCHNRYDKAHRMNNARKTRLKGQTEIAF